VRQGKRKEKRKSIRKLEETNVWEKEGKIRFSIGDLNGEGEQSLNLKANL
jgi:hypothetical protein